MIFNFFDLFILALKRLTIFLVFFSCFAVSIIYSKEYVNVENNEKYKPFLTISTGYHWGDNRFKGMPIVFIGAGFYITNGLLIKAEYIPIFMEIKNNNYPLYVFEGIERLIGDRFIIHQYFISIDAAIYKQLWVNFGLAPENIFSLKVGLKFNFKLDEKFLLSAEYNFLMIGRPILNSRNHAFLSNSLILSINYLIY